MHQPRYYIRDHDGTVHRTDDAAVFDRMFANEDLTDIDVTSVGDVLITTTFTGLDCNQSDTGPPILFSTLVFGGPLGGQERLYPTETEARLGHHEVTEQVRQQLCLQTTEHVT